MNPLLREVTIAVLRLRLRWWRWAEFHIPKHHTDLPHILRTQWDLTNRIKELENERTFHSVR